MAQRLSRPSPPWGIAAVFLCLSGCGSEPLFPVEGQVKFEGKRLTKGTVVLFPDASKGNTSEQDSRGNIEADGRFKIITRPHPGAPPGWYKVAVVVTEASDPQVPYSKPRWLIPEKFGNPEESQLTLEVRAEAPAGAYDLDIK